MATLQAVLLRLDPPPYELNASGVRSLDLLFAELFALFDTFPNFSAFLSLSGFCLDNLRSRGRTGFLNRLSELSRSGRIEILERPYYPPSAQLLSAERFVENVALNQAFWDELGVRLSSNPFPNVSAPQSVVPLSEKLRVELTYGELRSIKDWATVAHTLKSLLSSTAGQFILSPEIRAAGYSVPEMGVPASVATPNYLASRVQILWAGIEAVPELLNARLMKAKAENRRVERTGGEERLKAAKKFAHQASSQFIDDALNPLAQRACFEAILSAEVELEGFLHPDVDPSVGWIRLLSADTRSLINTQLYDAFLAPDGGILEFDYKPRKLALLGAFPGRSFEIEPSLPPNARSAAPGKIIRRTLDLLSIRYEEEFIFNGKPLHVIRELAFKAGIGAHLPNATTGFSCEYWVEGEVPPGLELALKFSASPGAPALSALLGKPLLCVGGVSELRLSGEESSSVVGTELPGGLFGLRLIDTVEDLSIDFRSSKQLERMSTEPSSVQGVPQSLEIRFVLSARRILGDDKSNTVFVSIL